MGNKNTAEIRICEMRASLESPVRWPGNDVWYILKNMELLLITGFLFSVLKISDMVTT
jgi:hypothetical protein